jgi:hypothetical protein
VIVKKILFKLTVLLPFLAACEFRPPSYEFGDYPLEHTRCYYPIAEVHNYNSPSSTITECYYTSSQTVKEELIFDATSTEMIGMITYQYKHTYYLKTVYDYVNGLQDSHYVTGIYYINTESL